jgi:hypothetical protein
LIEQWPLNLINENSGLILTSKVYISPISNEIQRYPFSNDGDVWGTTMTVLIMISISLRRLAPELFSSTAQDAIICVYLARLTNFDCGLFHLPTLDTPNLTTDIWIWNGAHGGCDRSAEDAHYFATPDPTFAFVGGSCCPTLDFVIAFWLAGSIPIPLVLTYCKCPTELNPGTKKCTSSNFERVLWGLYFGTEGYFRQKVRNLKDLTVSASWKKSSIFSRINKYFTYIIYDTSSWGLGLTHMLHSTNLLDIYFQMKLDPLKSLHDFTRNFA